MKIKSFRDLKIYQLSVDLSKDIYQLVEKLPKSQKFVLNDQILRAVNSVGANIAEGFGRFHKKEFIQFLYLSRGSLMEVLHFLIICKELTYISKEQFNKLDQKITVLGIKINNLISSIYKK